MLKDGLIGGLLTRRMVDERPCPQARECRAREQPLAFGIESNRMARPIPICRHENYFLGRLHVPEPRALCVDSGQPLAVRAQNAHESAPCGIQSGQTATFASGSELEESACPVTAARGNSSVIAGKSP